MRALGHQRIERCDAALVEKLSGDGKEQVSIIVASLIGNDCQHALTGLDHLERSHKKAQNVQDG